MKLNEIMEIVHNAYPDGMTRNIWNGEQERARSGSGDTLAEFIVREIADTYDAAVTDLDQLKEALRVMERARADVDLVITALQRTLEQSKPDRHVPAGNASTNDSLVSKHPSVWRSHEEP